MNTAALYLAYDFRIFMKAKMEFSGLDLYVSDYEIGNHFVLKKSNTIEKDRIPKIDSDKNSPKSLHIVKDDLCERSSGRLCRRCSDVYRYGSMDIWVSKSSAPNLNCEENGTLEDVALLLIACWGYFRCRVAEQHLTQALHTAPFGF